MDSLDTLPLGELLTRNGREYRTLTEGGATVTIEPTDGGPAETLPGTLLVDVVPFAFGAFA